MLGISRIVLVFATVIPVMVIFIPSAAMEWHAETPEQFRNRYPAFSKHVLLYFHAADSGGCAMMLQKTFADTDLLRTLQAVGRVKIDTGTETGKKVSSGFGIPGYPAMVLLNPEGNEVTRRIGFLPPRECTLWIQDALFGKKVLSAFLAQLEKTPDDPGLNLTIARVYRDRMNVEQATAYYRKVRVLDPENKHGLNAIAIFELANLFRETGRNKESVILYKIFLGKHPRDRLSEIVYLTLIDVYKTTGQSGRALETLREYRDLFYVYYRAHCRFARFCVEQDRLLEEALDAAQTAVKISPDSVETLETLARVHAAMGNCAMARESIRKALELDPESMDLKKQLGLYSRKTCK